MFLDPSHQERYESCIIRCKSVLGKGVMRYKAFMSYSHEDRGLAGTIESALSRIAIPWYRRPTIQIFRDETILPTTSDLEKTIEEALNTTEPFLPLPSPLAALSHC